MKYLVQNGMEISKWAVGPIDANNCGHIVGISTSYNIYRETPLFKYKVEALQDFGFVPK